MNLLRDRRDLGGGIVLAMAFVLLAGIAFAQLATPKLTGRVVDLAGLLSAGQETALTKTLADHENVTTEQIVVVTLPSLEGDVLEQVSLRLAREWGIGQADFNNGALLLVAQAERKVRIEVGYGLEGRLTDAQAGLIIRNVIVPKFKAGDFPGGIANGAQAMLDVLGGEPQQLPLTGSFDDDDLAMIVFFLFIAIFFILPLIASMWQAATMTEEEKRKRRKSGRSTGWLSGGGGRSSGGGGFSGGGGSFGGGGSSGGW